MAASELPEIAGQIRTQQNWIGGNNYNPCGADFVPPPPEEVTPSSRDLCTFCNDETLPPLVQAALAHAQFETIHPHKDGNGRAGRALVQIILKRRNVAPHFVPPISVVLAQNKEQYIDGLVAYREGNFERWLEVFSVATARAAQLAAPLPCRGPRTPRCVARSALRPRTGAPGCRCLATHRHPAGTSGNHSSSGRNPP